MGAIQSKFQIIFRLQSDENQGEFRGISDEIQMDFRGSQMVFKVTSGGFPMKFQMDFRALLCSEYVLRSIGFRGLETYNQRTPLKVL